MNAEEFVKNFYIEKQNILNTSFDFKSEFKSYVAIKIGELNLDEIETENLKNIISAILNDTFYTILLGLDGSANIGNNMQEIFKIYDEENNLISNCGEIEALAYEYFQDNKLETEKSKCDFVAKLFFKTEKDGGRKSFAISGYRPHIKFNFDDFLTSGQQVYIGTKYAFPGDIVNAEIKLLSTEYFYRKLKENMKFEFYEGPNLIGTGLIIKIINQKLK